MNAMDKSNALVWHHNFLLLILGDSCSLELSEKVLCRNPKDTKDVMATDSSKDTSTSGVLPEPVKMESRHVQSP